VDALGTRATRVGRLGGISDPVSVMWEVAADDAMSNVVCTGAAEADSRLAYSVHVEVSGLKPGFPYWYRFTALGQQSPIGRAKTAPAPNDRPDSMRFAFASCSNWQAGYFSAYRHMAAENPDLVIFLGDYIYEDTATGANADKVLRKHDGPTATQVGRRSTRICECRYKDPPAPLRSAFDAQSAAQEDAARPRFKVGEFGCVTGGHLRREGGPKETL